MKSGWKSETSALKTKETQVLFTQLALGHGKKGLCADFLVHAAGPENLMIIFFWPYCMVWTRPKHAPRGVVKYLMIILKQVILCLHKKTCGHSLEAPG